MNRNKLHTENFGGNVHATATAINKLGWARYVLSMESSGFNTVVVFLMPAQMVWEIREASKSFVTDPRHDDDVQTAKMNWRITHV